MVSAILEALSKGSQYVNNDDLAAAAASSISGENFMLGRGVDTMNSIFGSDIMSQLSQGIFNPDDADNAERFQKAMSDPAMNAMITKLNGSFKAMSSLMGDFAGETEFTADKQKELYQEMISDWASAEVQGNAMADSIVGVFTNLHGSETEVNKAIEDMGNDMTRIKDLIIAMDDVRGKSGAQVSKMAHADEIFGAISQFSNVDIERIKAADAAGLEEIIDAAMANAQEKYAMYAEVTRLMFEEALMNVFKDKPLELAEWIQAHVNADGTIDLTDLQEFCDQYKQKILDKLAENEGVVGSLVLDISTDKNGNIKTQLVTEKNKKNNNQQTTSIYKSKSQLGGGKKNQQYTYNKPTSQKKEKTAAQKLLESIKRQKELLDHEIKMIQSQEQYYETQEEITNYNRMLELENQAQEKTKASLEGMIYQLRAQLAVTQQGTDDWFNLYQTILSYEEAVESANNAIAANNRKIKENRQAIIKLRVDLENLVDQEIRAQKQKERDMADATVQMEKIVLEAIKKRYQNEWDLIKRDLDKKKQALADESKLIDERLQRRKNAEDEANKYEELAELQRQYASISMDSTRTKDAEALREKIAALEKEIAWDIADEQAAAQKASLEDQIQGYEDRITYGDEYMQEMLSNEQNFAEEVNEVMALSQEELFEWLKNNVDEYITSLEDSQHQMLRSWEDTYKQMKGITDTYWTEVASILTSNDTFMNYMRNTDTYKNASEYQKQMYEYEWSQMYDRWLKGQKDDATYTHYDDNSGNYGTWSTGNGDDTTYNQPVEDNYIPYEGPGPGEDEQKPKTQTQTKRTYPNPKTQTAPSKMYYYLWDNKTNQAVYGPVEYNEAKLRKRRLYANNNDVHIIDSEWYDRLYEMYANQRVIQKTGYMGPASVTHTAMAKGGYIPSTEMVRSRMGTIRVDGTPTNPEMVLDAYATKSLDDFIDAPGTARVDYFADRIARTKDLLSNLSTTDMDADLAKMMEMAKYISLPRLLTNVAVSGLGSESNVTIGDIHIEINEAEINTDDDYETVARNVGNALVKEISRYGLSVSNI